MISYMNLHAIDGFMVHMRDSSITHYQAGVEDNTLIQPHPFFDNSKYVFIKEVEVKAADGRWRSARIFGRKELPTTVVIFFGGNECEGLNGDIKMDPLTGRIFDGERRIIEARPPQKDFRSVCQMTIYRRLALISVYVYGCVCEEERDAHYACDVAPQLLTNREIIQPT